MYQSFNRTNQQGARVPDPRFAALRGKLSVDRPAEWEEAIGMDPAEFYRLWTADLPGMVTMQVELNSGGQGEISLRSSGQGRHYFEATRRFDRPRGTMELKEVRIENPDLRRKGIGKVLLDNQFNVARRWGLHKFTLRAGREDGPYFWARRGAYMEDSPNAAPERQPLHYFSRDIEKGLYELEGSLSERFASAVRAELDKGGLDLNTRLARLPGAAEAAELFGFVTEYRAYFDLADPVQMAQVQKSLGDINGLREGLRVQFAP